MQPTRVTSATATLIDNIFVNDIETRSRGGNITSSISDHFSQFCFMDIFNKPKQRKVPRYGRSYKNFNEDEFNNELKKSIGMNYSEIKLVNNVQACSITP